MESKRREFVDIDFIKDLGMGMVVFGFLLLLMLLFILLPHHISGNKNKHVGAY